MVRRLSVVSCAIGMIALLSYCGDPEADPVLDAGADAAIHVRDADQELPEGDAGPRADAGRPVQDAGIISDAGEVTDAGQPAPDVGIFSDAGEVTDAGQPEPDAGSVSDAGHLVQDAGSGMLDGGDPHANADKLEYCGSGSSLPSGRDFTVTLNGQTIDFAGGYFWGVYSPETPSFYGDSTFTWLSTDGQYFLELVVHQGFLGMCPVTLSLPSNEVVWNLYDTAQPPTVDLFSSDEGASGSLKLDAYDLAGEACSVSVECANCRLVWGSDVAVVDGQAVESCL
ncbi:MAG: hypothetical protein HY901_04565 [Deltaproteobacteria bacterium]|nr:hypothetical protein [Deltaproteobacteria bacterium]